MYALIGANEGDGLGFVYALIGANEGDGLGFAYALYAAIAVTVDNIMFIS